MSIQLLIWAVKSTIHAALGIGLSVHKQDSVMMMGDGLELLQNVKVCNKNF